MLFVGLLQTIPEGGDTKFVDNFAIAVPGAAGATAIVVTKHDLSVQPVVESLDQTMNFIETRSLRV